MTQYWYFEIVIFTLNNDYLICFVYRRAAYGSDGTRIRLVARPVDNVGGACTTVDSDCECVT